VSETAPEAPTPRAGTTYILPERLSYRLKRKLLGPPLTTERLADERLGKVAALGVLASDFISSTAYGSEEMLNQLIPYFGLAAFSLLLPITFVVLMVLFFVTMSYREVVMVYTKAGGSYVVARDNFGPRIAQIAAVALIIDYIVTVAVQISAGTDALTSAFPGLKGATVEITVGVVLVLAYGNLRGIREAGKAFALPAYLFIASVGSLVIIGVVRTLLGQLHAHSIDHSGVVKIGSHGSASLLVAASIFFMLKAFANGGSSLTGLEAISNGVANFREPTGRNARRVLVIMSCTLGSLVLGVSFLAHVTHAVPYTGGSPTVLLQEAHYVFGYGAFGKLAFYLVTATTMLILFTGGNTSFNGFPNLTSFVAKDAYLPRQLTRRGHRLVFSNGIIILTIASLALIIATRANLTALVALYAIGVFTGFTMAGSGMVKHHLTHRDPGWKRKIVINGFAAVLSLVVVAIFAITKFTEGAWLVVVLFPILVFVLIRLHKQYQEEAAELATTAPRAAAVPVLRRHAVIVLVERLDLATARALQYARTLLPDELLAVHFVLDTKVAQELETQWTQLGLARFPLDLVECPDRRLERAAMELVAEAATDGQTEVTVVLPRRGFESYWQRVLHDRTADHIAANVSQIPNANATIIPFPLGKRRRVLVPWRAGATEIAVPDRSSGRGGRPTGPAHPWGTGVPETKRDARAGDRERDRVRERARGRGADAPGSIAIAELRPRQRARVTGRVRSVRVQAGGGVPSIECTIADATGQLMLIFQGRRRVPGIEPGARLTAEGMVGEQRRRTAMINPLFTILRTSEGSDESVPEPRPTHPR
jgi:amino acid transporter